MTNSIHLEDDWYPGGIPANVEIGKGTYIDSSYAFAACCSKRQPAVQLGDYSGVYDRASLVVGPNGRVLVGPYTCLNGTQVVCQDLVSIGAHCLLAWGVVITDDEPDQSVSIYDRRQALSQVADSPDRYFPNVGHASPVTIEDNVWIGFDSVVRPGVCVGRGSIVGCKSIVEEHVPPYSVVVGNPARRVRELDPDDTPQARQQAFKEYLRG